MPIEVVWFKRDLRTSDHLPLFEATNGDLPVLCLFLIEPQRLAQPDCDPIHIEWELDCAYELRKKLEEAGANLDIMHSDALEAIEEIHAKYTISRIRSHEETGTSWSFDRDKQVSGWCIENNVEWLEYPNNGVIRGMNERDKWKTSRDRRMGLDLLAPPKKIAGVQSVPGNVTMQSIGIGRRQIIHRPVPGQDAAMDVLRSFLSSRGESYRWSMSSPSLAVDNCSRLAPYFSTGCISVRRVVQTTSAKMRRLKEARSRGEDVGGWLQSLSSFQSRLAWHCHFMQKLEMEPTLDTRAQNPLIDENMNRVMDKERFRAWSEGKTGWPFFDACMRSLIATGWINFRMRAMMMSAASYNLWLPWRETGLHLARQFLDYEPGIHWSQVGMQSGTTGINTVRAYSVIKQGRDHDPKGEFIRKWVSEMGSVPDKYVHEPWKMPQELQNDVDCVIGKHYPYPIVEEASARKEGVRRTYAARSGEETREASKKVYQKHGSRRRPAGRRKERSARDSRQAKLF